MPKHRKRSDGTIKHIEICLSSLRTSISSKHGVKIKNKKKSD